MEIVCRGDERGEGLLYMCDRLKALGMVVSWAGYQQDGGEMVDLCGQGLGDAISDYAKAIHETINKVWDVINEYFENGGVSTLLRLKAVQEKTKRNDVDSGMKLYCVKKALAEADQFLDGELKEIVAVKAALELYRDQTEKALVKRNGGAKVQGGS